MAALSPGAAVRAIADGDRSPTWYLTGDEDVLKQELVDAVLAAVLDPSTRDFNADIRSAGDLDGESFNALVETPPMLAEQRVVVVRGVEQWRKNAKVWQVVHRYLEHANPTTLLVLIHGAGQAPDGKIKGAVERHVDARAPTPDECATWLTRRADLLHADLEPAAAEHLLDAVGEDLGALQRELEKIAASADDRITLELVQDMVGVRRGETLHDWVDAVLNRDTARAVDLVGVVLQQSGVTGVRMVITLGTALVGTRLARGLLDGGATPRRLEGALMSALKAARPFGLRPWGVEARTWARAAAKWGGSDLDLALRGALEADRQLKSTTVTDERGIVLGLVLALGPAAAAA